MKQWKNAIPYKPYTLGQELTTDRPEGATILLKATVPTLYRAYIIGIVTDRNGVEHEVCFDFNNWSNTRGKGVYPNTFHLKYREKIKIINLDECDLEYDIY